MTPREAWMPLLILRYRSTPTAELSEETGVPVNTLRSWAHRAGLTSKDRIRLSGREWGQRPRGAQHKARSA